MTELNSTINIKNQEMKVLTLTDNKPSRPYLRCGVFTDLKYGADCHKILANSDFSNTESRNNGFFWSALDAYCDHNNLYLSPDDVWIQILSQFARYVSHHESILKSKFIESSTISLGIDIDEINEDHLSNSIGSYLTPEAKQLIIPSFTTTTPTHQLISQLMISSNMKQYYGKLIELKCGIPSIHLYGEISDWEKLIETTLQLKKFGQDDGFIDQWLQLLVPILEKFLLTSKGDETPELKKWWNQICHCRTGYSGTTFVSGWLSVFCMMNEDANGFYFNQEKTSGSFQSEWPILYTNKIPTAFVSTPVSFVKNNTKTHAKIFSGLMGSAIVTDDQYGIRPSALWVIAEVIACDDSVNRLLHEHQLNLTKIHQKCDFCFKVFDSTYSCIPCDRNVCKNCMEKIKSVVEENGIDYTIDDIINQCGFLENPPVVDFEPHVTLCISSVHKNVPALKYDVISTSNKIMPGKKTSGEIRMGLDFKNFMVKPDTSNIQWNSNGFVNTCLLAYNEHHDLYLKPNDVWLCILSQFGLYVNYHTSALRKRVVNFEGKLQLEVKHEEIDIDRMASDFIGQTNEYLTDEIKTISSATFTTSTVHDKLVSNLMFLCIMKKFFALRYYLKCGLPSVTLYGTVADWELLLDLTKSLSQFDELDYSNCYDEYEDYFEYDDSNEHYINKWLELLVPILENFIRTAKGEDSDDLKKWWNQICHVYSGASGPTYISGWLSTFCMMQEDTDRKCFVFRNNKTLDNITSQWPFIDVDDVPSGFLYAPLEIVVGEKVRQCKIYAGLMGMTNVEHNKYGIKPVSMWAIANVHTIDPLLGQMLHRHELDVADLSKGYGHQCDICRNKIKTGHNCCMCDFDVCFNCADTLHQLTVYDHPHQLELRQQKSICTQCNENVDSAYFCNNCDVTYCFVCLNKCEWHGFENRINKPKKTD
jgi:hypothetical protein